MSLALQLRDYRLTTAEILYRLPDHPEIPSFRHPGAYMRLH